LRPTNGRYFQVHAGYLYDALTNEDLAHYGFIKNADGGIQGTDNVTEDQYKERVKKRMVSASRRATRQGWLDECPTRPRFVAVGRYRSVQSIAEPGGQAKMKVRPPFS
jgi:hypothetical protein